MYPFLVLVHCTVLYEYLSSFQILSCFNHCLIMDGKILNRIRNQARMVKELLQLLYQHVHVLVSIIKLSE